MRSTTRTLLSKYIFCNQQLVLLVKTPKCKNLHTGAIPKPYDEIPKDKRFFPSSLGLLLSGGPSYLHEHCDKRHKKLGPIFVERLGPNELVFVADAKMIQTVIANEGRQPHHNVPDAWMFYNRLHKIDRGLFFQVGEPWAKLRGAFNKVMLADPKSTLKFGKDILRINSDLFQGWATKQNCDKSFRLNDVKFELCKWSIESTGFMLFGHRIGCILGASSGSDVEKAEMLVQNVSDMFAETSHFQVLPVSLAHHFNTGTWRRFEVATTNMLKIANELTAKYIPLSKQSDAHLSLVADLLKLNILSDEEISRSIVDLVIAAADTTSNALQWMLYLIAKNQHVQDRIYDEVAPFFSSGEIDVDNFKLNTPYLSAFIKEAFRLYPTAPFLARTLDHDIALGGYRIPAGATIVFSLFTTSRMKEYFEDPTEFKPERWLRADFGGGCPKRRSNYAYATLPFGIGSRMCIGRRAADLEISLFIASFVNRFKSDIENEVRIKLKMILSPDRPIKLILTDRSK